MGAPKTKGKGTLFKFLQCAKADVTDSAMSKRELSTDAVEARDHKRQRERSRSKGSSDAKADGAVPDTTFLGQDVIDLEDSDDGEMVVAPSPSASSASVACPVCGVLQPSSSIEAHVNAHFESTAIRAQTAAGVGENNKGAPQLSRSNGVSCAASKRREVNSPDL